MTSRMTKLRGLLVLAFVLVMLVLGAIPVLAISVPDEGPYILRVDVYRHLLEVDDMLVLGRYNWPYASPPSETITQAVFVRLLDGATELAYCSPYAYYSNGWGYGSFSMYLSAAEASGYWEDTLTVEVRGSPTLNWTGGSNYVVSTTTLLWRSAATTSATQVLMYSHLISWADTLGDYWSVSLVSTYAGGDKLSSYGAEYFTNVVTGLRTMVPNLFSGAVETPTYTDITYNTSASDEAMDVWPFDMGGISEWFGLPSSDDVLRTIIAFVVIFIVAMVMARQGIPTQFVLFACFGLLFVLAVPGLISRLIVGGMCFVVILLTGLVFLLRRT